MLKRFIGTIFICIYLLSFTEGYQLFKIPVLIQHLKEHRKIEPEMSFAKFIRIHYMGPDVVYDDYQRDQQLPFRNIDFNILHTTCIARPVLFEIGIQPPAEPIKNFNSRPVINKSRLSAFDIFQPPRCA